MLSSTPACTAVTVDDNTSRRAPVWMRDSSCAAAPRGIVAPRHTSTASDATYGRIHDRTRWRCSTSV